VEVEKMGGFLLVFAQIPCRLPNRFRGGLVFKAHRLVYLRLIDLCGGGEDGGLPAGLCTDPVLTAFWVCVSGGGLVFKAHRLCVSMLINFVYHGLCTDPVPSA